MGESKVKTNLLCSHKVQRYRQLQHSIKTVIILLIISRLSAIMQKSHSPTGDTIGQNNRPM